MQSCRIVWKIFGMISLHWLWSYSKNCYDENWQNWKYSFVKLHQKRNDIAKYSGKWFRASRNFNNIYIQYIDNEKNHASHLVCAQCTRGVDIFPRIYHLKWFDFDEIIIDFGLNISSVLHEPISWCHFSCICRIFSPIALNICRQNVWSLLPSIRLNSPFIECPIP